MPPVAAIVAAGLIAFAALVGTGVSPRGADAQTLSTVGQWSSVMTWPVQATHAHLLPTGKVLFYPAWTGDFPYLWDPTDGSISTAANAGYNIFCNGHAFLPDGRLLVTGGHVENHIGLPNASIYDPFSNSWTHLPDMNDKRWYPTNTTLANGDILVVGGEKEIGSDGFVVYNPLPQVWQRSTQSWRNLSGAQLVLDEWYPFMYLAPNGKVFKAGNDQVTRYLDTTGTGAWTDVANSNFGDRPQGSSVMYADGKVLILGGSDPPSASAEVIDLTAGSPAWRPTASMNDARRNANATLLPDGTVLVTGGSSGPGWDNSAYPVYAAELWNPSTETWTTLAGNAVYRGYHSSSLLLPDGRVLSAGGEIGGATAEVFSPPYLFKGARPTIDSAPDSVGYGQTFAVGTPDAATITAVTWLRLGSVTHAYDESQRINRLAFTAAAGAVNVTAPTSPSLSPPGYYMVFILNGNGVPSVARMVRLGEDATPPTPTPTATLALTPTPTAKTAPTSTPTTAPTSTPPPAATSTPTPLPTATATPLTVPAAPSSLTAIEVTLQRVTLRWSDTANNEQGFRIERSSDGTTFSQVGTAGVNATQFSDTQVTRNRSYWYRVRAYNAAGASTPSNTVLVRVRR